MSRKQWTKLSPEQIQFLNRQFTAIQEANDLTDREMAAACEISPKSVQEYAGRQPTPSRIMTATLRRIAKLAADPKEFSEQLQFSLEEEKGEDPLGELRQLVEARFQILETKIQALGKKNMCIPNPNPLTFAERILLHAQQMGDSLSAIASNTRIPEPRLQAILDGNGIVKPKITRTEITALGTYVQDMRGLEQILNVPEKKVNPRQSLNGSPATQEGER